MTQVFFYIMAALIVGGALGVVLVRSTVYAALLLIVSLMGVAGLYLLLASEFLALVQVLIYGGAVTVLLLFALMLTRVRDLGESPNGAQWPVAALTGVALIAAFAVMMSETTWPRDTNEISVVPFTSIGDALFNRWAAPFEIASAVLLAALVGAVVIATQEEGEA